MFQFRPVSGTEIFFRCCAITSSSVPGMKCSAVLTCCRMPYLDLSEGTTQGLAQPMVSTYCVESTSGRGGMCADTLSVWMQRGMCLAALYFLPVSLTICTCSQEAAVAAMGAGASVLLWCRYGVCLVYSILLVRYFQSNQSGESLIISCW